MFRPTLSELRDAVCAAASALEPERFDQATAIHGVEQWTAIVNAAAAARSLLAARALECGVPVGASDDASWLASATGTTSARAKETIRAGRSMRTQRRTREAATNGRLSADQAAAITDAVDADPTAEDRLNDEAERTSLGELRNACAKTKANADPDPSATERRIHAGRHVRRYRDAGGAEHLHATGTKVEMAKIDQALRPIIDEVFNERRGDGPRESLETYAFDALVRLADGSSAASAVGKNGQPKLRYLGLLRIDWEALVRGIAEANEICEINGLGPIPVATARELLGESILKLVITKGEDVLHVTHLGRGPNAAQKVALLWQQPVCSREGCGRTGRLEADHRDDYARVRCTELGNLDHYCDPDHDLKTRFGWALVEGTGKRPMVPPDDPRHPKNAAARRPPP